MKNHVDAGVNIVVAHLAELSDGGMPARRAVAGEVIAPARQRFKTNADGARVGARQTDGNAVSAKTAAIEQRDLFRSAAAEEAHVLGGLAGVRPSSLFPAGGRCKAAHTGTVSWNWLE